ncbi:MAG: hypothetical protein DMG97_40635 [Acidobacteria bacterium]|nr:MAG: hypothetical protein DMG97_40635 [Acidobacteriota bacterium]
MAWGTLCICPGVTIGNNSVIGAGSVVVRDIPANRVAVGNPCRVIREVGRVRMGKVQGQGNRSATRPCFPPPQLS